MNTETIAPFATSLIRAGLIALATRLGVDHDPAKLTELSTWIWSLLAAAIAVAWSGWAHRKAAAAPPPGVISMTHDDGTRSVVAGDGSVTRTP